MKAHTYTAGTVSPKIAVEKDPDTERFGIRIGPEDNPQYLYFDKRMPPESFVEGKNRYIEGVFVYSYTTEITLARPQHGTSSGLEKILLLVRGYEIFEYNRAERLLIDEDTNESLWLVSTYGFLSLKQKGRKIKLLNQLGNLRKQK